MKKRNTTYRLNIVDYLIFILCSLAAAAALFLFYRDLNSYTIKQAEEPIAKIYFKKNTAQRKFVDNDIWEVLTNSSDIYDGDRIRTSKDSEAYTEFNDSGIQIQLREKSMVQIFKNKKERSVDFIGGEIFVATTKPDEKIVIHSGKNEISIGQVSEVKLILPEVPAAVAAGEEEAVEESPVLIEVISGQVEVIEVPAPAKSKTEKKEPEAIIVSAGESFTFGPDVVEESNGEIVEISEPERVEKKSLPPPETVTQGIEKVIVRDIVLFGKTYFDEANGKYNYANGFLLSDITGNNKTIPAGAIIEYIIKGKCSNDLNRFVIQMPTGEDEWKQAHAFIETCPNNGAGMKKDVPFEEKTTLILTNDIVNTDKAWVNMSYEPRILDEPVLFYDFQVKVRVVSLDGVKNRMPIESGYTKTFEYQNLSFVKDQWGEKSDEFNYKIQLSSEKIFGSLKSIPKGTNIKITISGTTDSQIAWIGPEFVHVEDEWIQLFRADYDVYQIRFNQDQPISKNEQFSYSRVFTTIQDLPDTLEGILNIIASDEGLNKPPFFENLTITFEVQ